MTHILCKILNVFFWCSNTETLLTMYRTGKTHITCYTDFVDLMSQTF